MYDEMSNWELMDYLAFGQRASVMCAVELQLSVNDDYVETSEIKEYINSHDWSHLLRLYLEWNGIIGYHDQIADFMEVMYGKRCKE